MSLVEIMKKTCFSLQWGWSLVVRVQFRRIFQHIDPTSFTEPSGNEFIIIVVVVAVIIVVAVRTGFSEVVSNKNITLVTKHLRSL